MHPPFFTVDHKIGPDIHHESDSRPVKRRGSAKRLRLSPATAGWPPAPLVAPWLFTDDEVTLPTGAPALSRPQLRVVPPPRRTLRDAVGRWLIRMGQRMILQNRLG